MIVQQRYIRAPGLDAHTSYGRLLRLSMAQLDNISPEVFAKSQARADLPEDYDDAVVDPIDTREIFGELRILDLLWSGESTI